MILSHFSEYDLLSFIVVDSFFQLFDFAPERRGF